MSRNPYIDITAGRHGGNKQSQAANIELAPYKVGWQEKILGLMAIRDAQGLGTSRRHAADHFGKEAGQISGRFTELKVAGLIEETKFIEDGFMVYRLPGSLRVALNNAPRKVCLVTGVALAGEIVVEKGTAGWQIVRITPNLSKLVEGIPVPEIGNRLTALHLNYTWLKT